MNSAIRKLRGPEFKYEDEEEKLLIEQAARLTGLTPTAFVKSNAIKAAREALSEKTTVLLSDADWNLVIDLLENPPEPNEALRKLMIED